MVESRVENPPLKTFTRADLIEAVHRKTGFSQRMVGQIVERIFMEMRSAFLRGEEVKIPNFGTFAVRIRHARVGQNMHTGQKVLIEPRLSVSLRTSHVLKEKIDLSHKEISERILTP